MTDTQRRDAQIAARIAAELEGQKLPVFGPHPDDPRRDSMHMFLAHQGPGMLQTLQNLADDAGCSVESMAYQIWLIGFGVVIAEAISRWQAEGKALAEKQPEGKV